MNGKNKCKILKDIRRQIAQDNDIEFITSECKYQGECTGTCPKCEAELRYLENELRKRQKLGKGIAIAGAVEELSEVELRKQFEINFYGLLKIIKHIAPFLEEKGRLNYEKAFF